MMIIRSAGFSIVALASCLLFLVADGFQLNMMSQQPGSSNSFRESLKRANPFGSGNNSGSPLRPGDVSGKLISQLAVIALKLRLADQTSVSCDVTGENMLQGAIGPVTVKGRGWQSSMGLTCMAIEATVDTCQLDMNRVMSNRKLVLTEPALGKAMVALSSKDFGNFITHPRLRPPGLPQTGENGSSGTAELTFIREGSKVNASTGSVTFFAMYMGAKYRCSLSKEDGRALVTLEPVDDDNDNHVVAKELTRVMTDFFNSMTFELDGTFLSFRDMMVTDKGKESNVMLSLNIKVEKFPSPGLEF